jgi:hypothetical protein
VRVCWCVRAPREGGGLRGQRTHVRVCVCVGGGGGERVLRGCTVELWDMAFAANRFTLVGTKHTLAQNNGPNALHGEGGGVCKQRVVDTLAVECCVGAWGVGNADVCRAGGGGGAGLSSCTAGVKY